MNPHPVKDWILSPARLPIPPLSRFWGGCLSLVFDKPRGASRVLPRGSSIFPFCRRLRPRFLTVDRFSRLGFGAPQNYLPAVGVLASVLAAGLTFAGTSAGFSCTSCSTSVAIS